MNGAPIILKAGFGGLGGFEGPADGPAPDALGPGSAMIVSWSRARWLSLLDQKVFGQERNDSGDCSGRSGEESRRVSLGVPLRIFSLVTFDGESRRQCYDC